MTTLPDLEELKRLAEAAMPGPWTAGSGKSESPYVFGPRGSAVAEYLIEEDAFYIAAIDPQTVLALVEAVEEARGLVRFLMGLTGVKKDLDHVRQECLDFLARFGKEGGG